MIAVDGTAGNAFTSDPDYNEFLGKQYEGIVYDWTRRCWVKCKMQAPKTPKDVIPANDPDKELTEEQMWHEPYNPAGAEAAQIANRNAGNARRAAMQGHIVNCITRYGVMTAQELATELDFIYSTVTTHLLTHEGQVYCRVGKAKTGGKPPSLWGLVGVHDTQKDAA